VPFRAGPRKRQSPSFRGAITLLEVMIVIVLLTIITGLVIPYAGTNRVEVLRTAAEILAADLAFTRSLAVTQAAPYKLVLFPRTGRYWIECAENSPPGRELPRSPFANLDSTTRRMVFQLEDIPGVGRGVTVWGCTPNQGSGEQTIVFDPLGGLTSGQDVSIFLTVSENNRPWYVEIRVGAATGRCEVGRPTRTPPGTAL